MSAADPKNRGVRTLVSSLVSGAASALGDLLSVVTRADGTSASRGKLIRATTDINRLAAGWAREGARTGVADGSVEQVAEHNNGDYARELAVTGVTGIVDIGSPVYATAHGTYTIARAARAIPVGYVLAYVSTGRAVVALWNPFTLAQFAVVRETVELGTIILAGTDTTKTLLKWPVPYRCRIASVSAYYSAAAAGSGAASALTFRRDPLAAGSGHVAVTGGSIALLTDAGDVEGSVKEGSAITANNDLYEGDLLEGILAITDAGTFTAGTVNVRAVLDRFPGN